MSMRSCVARDWRSFEFFAPREEGVLAIAHRGGVRNGEEALEGLLRTLKLGILFLEVDLRVSGEDELVVWHGHGLERLMRRHRVNVERFERGVVIPFRSVLEALPNDVRFFVDLKDDRTGRLLAGLLREQKAAHRVCIGSFSHRRTMSAVAAVQSATGVAPCVSLTPRQAVSLVVSNAAVACRRRALHPHHCRHARSARFTSAQIPVWMASPALVALTHEAGALVFPWTVNDRVTMRLLLERGVDGVITDQPELFIHVVREVLGDQKFSPNKK